MILTTEGGEGQSLVKGVQVKLKAIALRIQSGAKVGEVRIGGLVRTNGDNVVTVEIDGEVGTIDAAGGIVAEGKDSDAVHVRGDAGGLDGVSVRADHGQSVVRTH